MIEDQTKVGEKHCITFKEANERTNYLKGHIVFHNIHSKTYFFKLLN